MTATPKSGVRALLTAIALLTVGALSACGTADAPTASPVPHATGSSSVETAATVDPHSLRGASTAESIASVVPISKSTVSKLPVTLTDAGGTSVTITSTSRIIALDLYGTLAETVVGLGFGDRLVGRGSNNTLDSMRSLPVVTENGHELNGEAILALSPTVVLTDTSIGPREVQAQLRASGVAVVFFDPKRTLDSVGPQVIAVADALGAHSTGVKLAKRSVDEIAEAKTAIAAMTPPTAKKLRVAFLYVRGNGAVFFILGRGEGADQLIQSIAAEDVATEAGVVGVKPANSEALLALNPDVVLTMTSGLQSTGGIDGLLKRPGVSDTTAGRNHRVVDMADGQVLSFGPTTGAVLRSLAQAVYAPKELRP